MSDPDAGVPGIPDAGSQGGPPGPPADEGGRTAGGGPEGDGGGETTINRTWRGVLSLVSVMVVYYAVPVGELPSGAAVVFSVLGLLGGIAVLAWLMIRQVQRLARSDPGDESVRLDSLIFLVFVVVPMFAIGYLALEQADGSQFESLSTKTDALYFTVSTLATVGFGDVHATGQLARGLVTIQIAFDLVFVAALVSVVTGQIRERAAARRAAERRASGL